MDPKVNGQIQKEWGWLVAAYLFFGGVGAGAYVIVAVNGLLGEASLATEIGLWLSFPAVLVGSICLLLDLGQPLKAVLAGLKPGTSWIARGFWIISLFMLVAFLHAVAYTFSTVGIEILALLSVVGIVLAVGTMAYTGILLSASKGMPFWRAGIVPVVFVVSALVTGHFSILILVAVAGMDEVALDVRGIAVMAAEAAALVVFEILALLFFLQQAFRHPDAKESAQRVLRHKGFVVGYLVAGLLAPLVLMLLVYAAGDGLLLPDGVVAVTAAIGSLLGLVGGLILRYSVLLFGALPTWNIAGFKFRRISRPKDPRPEIGLLPPS